MKKVFLTLALVFATSTVLVSCGDDASKDATASTPDADAKDDKKEDKTTTTVDKTSTTNA